MTTVDRKTWHIRLKDTLLWGREILLQQESTTGMLLLASTQPWWIECFNSGAGYFLANLLKFQIRCRIVSSKPVEVELKLRWGVSIPWPGDCVSILKQQCQICLNGPQRCSWNKKDTTHFLPGLLWRCPNQSSHSPSWPPPTRCKTGTKN